MKKGLSLILALMILLSAISGIPVFAADEFVFCDSFEAGVTNWTYYGKGTRDNTKNALGKAKDGKMSLCVNDNLTDGTVGLQSRKINIEEAESYTVSASIYHEEGSSIKIQFNFVDANGKKLAGKALSTSALKQWTDVHLSQAAPVGASGIILIISGGTSETGITYIDSVKVEETKKSSLNAQTTTAKKGDVVYTESFENGADNWVPQSVAVGTHYKVSADDASDGKQSMYIWDELKDNVTGITSRKIPVEDSRNYQLQVDARPRKCRFMIYFRLYNENNEEIYRNLQYTEDATDRWDTYSVDLTAYPGSDYVKITFMTLDTDLASVGDAYFDNIKIIDMGSMGEIDEKSNQLKADINQKLAIAKPGDVIEIPDGTYEHVVLKFDSYGTEDKPITLKAKNPGKVIFKGFSGINISGAYLIVEGLVYENSLSVPYIINLMKTSKHCQIKECVILDCYSEDFYSNQRWISVAGYAHRITGCYLRGKTTKGMMLEILRYADVADDHIVENCYFGDFRYGHINGLETIRIGTGSHGDSYSNSTVRNCFFESCNSEVETISLKCWGNKIYNNTLYNSMGYFMARHGGDNEFVGNLFIGGEYTKRDTGIAVYGPDHLIKDNYFCNMNTGSAGVVAMDGNPAIEYLGFLEPVLNLDVSNNTFVNCDVSFKVGQYNPKPGTKNNEVEPPQGKIVNNALISYRGTNPQMVNGHPLPDNNKIVFENNFVAGKAVGYEGGTPEGVTYGDFEFTIQDGFVVPSNGTGANIEEVKKAPKNPFELITDWMKELLYDSGKYTFNVVKGDPFNSDCTIEDTMPDKEKIDVLVNGLRKKFDVEPQIINSRTMVPMRAIFEEFNAEVSWNEQTASATAQTEATTVQITRDSDVAYVNGAEIKLDSPAVIIDGRFLVPLRFVSESFGADVEWLGETQTALISYDEPVRHKYYQYYEPKFPVENILPAYGLIQSGNDGTEKNITYIMDGSLTDRWGFKDLPEGGKGYAIIDLGSTKTLESLFISFYPGTQRVYTFSIYISEDGENFTLIKDHIQSTGCTDSFEEIELTGLKARFVKYEGWGNSVNEWTNITEVFVTGK